MILLGLDFGILLNVVCFALSENSQKSNLNVRFVPFPQIFLLPSRLCYPLSPLPCFMAESQPQLQLQPPISLPTPNAAATTSVTRGTFFGMKSDLSKFQKNGLPALMEARQSDVPAWKASADVVSISNSKIEQSDAEKIHKRMTMNCESPGVPMEEFSKLKTLNDLKIAAYAKKKDTIDEEEDEFEFDDDLEDAFDDEGEEAVTFAPANSAKTRGKTIKMNADEFLKFNNSKIEKEQDAERKSIVQRRSVAAEKITNSASAIDAISGAVNEGERV